MADTLNKLEQDSLAVASETGYRKNTSFRIGNLFYRILQFFKNIFGGTYLLGEKENAAAIKAISNPTKGDAWRAKDTDHYWTYDGKEWNDIGIVLPSDAVVKSSLLSKSSIAYSIGGSTTININTVDETISCKDGLVLVGVQRMNISTHDVDYKDVEGVSLLIVYNKLTWQLEVLPVGETEKLSDNLFQIGFIRRDQKVYRINGAYSINGFVAREYAGELRNKKGVAYSVLYPKSFNVDLVKQNIILTNARIQIGDKSIDIASQEVDFSKTTVNSLSIIADYNNYIISVIPSVDLNYITETQSLLGVIRKELGFVYVNGMYSVNGEDVEQFTQGKLANYKQMAYSVGGVNSINVDTNLRKITFSNAYVYAGNKLLSSITAEIDFSVINANAVSILVDNNGNVIAVSTIDALNFDRSKHLLGVIRKDTREIVSFNGVYKVNSDIVVPYTYKNFNFDGGFFNYQPLGTVPIHNHTSLDDLYGLYDSLMAEHPNYITKSLLGNDAWNNPIYRYDFANKLPSGVQQFGKNKILILTHTHGQEKQSAWGAYLFFRALAKNKTDPALRYLRSNLRFTVIPIVSPTGFLKSQRKNDNGVDMNRGYAYNFEKLAPSDYYYGGEYPLQELEHQHINNLLQDEGHEFIFAVDKHNDDSYYARDYISWSYSISPEPLKMLNVWAKYHSQHIRDYFDFLTDENEHGLSRISANPSEGQTVGQFYLKGVNGSILETTQLRNEISLANGERFEVESLGNYLLAIAKRFL